MALGQGGVAIQICACLCSLIFLGGAITYGVFLGIYAYGNPDPADCWWIKGLEQSRTSAEAALELGANSNPIVTGVPIDVHAKFAGWFTWGFYTCIAPCLACPIMLCLALAKAQQLSMVVSGCVSCGVSISNLVWIIMGAVYRWGGMGKASTNTILEPRANFGTDLDYEQYVETVTA